MIDSNHRKGSGFGQGECAVVSRAGLIRTTQIPVRMLMFLRDSHKSLFFMHAWLPGSSTDLLEGSNVNNSTSLCYKPWHFSVRARLWQCKPHSTHMAKFPGRMKPSVDCHTEHTMYRVNGRVLSPTYPERAHSDDTGVVSLSQSP